LGYGAIDGENTIIEENSWTVTTDTNLYAVFIETDVYKLDYTDYLEIEGTKLKGLKKNKQNEYIYQGKKITIPANITTIESSAFDSYSGKNNNGNINYIFITPNSNLQEIGTYACRGPAIQYFDFTNAVKLRLIDYGAF
jgi:hypothetical protein